MGGDGGIGGSEGTWGVVIVLVARRTRAIWIDSFFREEASLPRSCESGQFFSSVFSFVSFRLIFCRARGIATWSSLFFWCDGMVVWRWEERRKKKQTKVGGETEKKQTKVGRK